MRSLILMVLAFTLVLAGPAPAVVINEFVANDLSTDSHEFIELCGNPDESLDGLAVILVEGEGTGAGTIDRIIDLAGLTIGGLGKFVIGTSLVNPDLEMSPNFLENGGNNILLVRSWNASVGDDIDQDGDCVVDDGVSIGDIEDGIGYGRPELGDCINYFGIPSLGPDGSYDPAGGARCDDCDSSGGDWYMICIDGTEPDGAGCSAEDGYFIAFATPGDINACAPVGNQTGSWGA